MIEGVSIMTSFYTGRGDEGETGLLGPGRVQKSDLRMETLGAVEEASAALGLARSLNQTKSDGLLIEIQRSLYRLMAEVAATPETSERFRSIDADSVEWLNRRIEDLKGRITLPDEFIVPGDSPAAAALDLARAIVRRAERRVVELSARGDVQNPELVRYLNRLSSFLFVLEIYEVQHGGRPPTLAKPDD